MKKRITTVFYSDFDGLQIKKPCSNIYKIVLTIKLFRWWIPIYVYYPNGKNKL
jgi:hypothetical protein